MAVARLQNPVQRGLDCLRVEEEVEESGAGDVNLRKGSRLIATQKLIREFGGQLPRRPAHPLRRNEGDVRREVAELRAIRRAHLDIGERFPSIEGAYGVGNGISNPRVQ